MMGYLIQADATIDEFDFIKVYFFMASFLEGLVLVGSNTYIHRLQALAVS
jgi:hypothetical protein